MRAISAIFWVLLLLVASGCGGKKTEPAPTRDALRPSSIAAPASMAPPLTVCSFNVQFLGSSRTRQSGILATVLEPYDIVLIQELVAPPGPGTFPDGTPYRPDPEAAKFFDAMEAVGFAWILSEEDTGRGARNQNNGTATEWHVAFYRPERVAHALDLPGGFLADDRTAHPNYDRVPYAFPFRDRHTGIDFVLINVHLRPDAGPANRERRAGELAAIAEWVATREGPERDYLIVGDMNIQNEAELFAATPEGFFSLNDECRPTNTTLSGGKPYDHVMYRPRYTVEIDTEFDLEVIDLVSAVRPHWDSANGRFPGDPYNHDAFRATFSDHHPIVFRFRADARDDD